MSAESRGTCRAALVSFLEPWSSVQSACFARDLAVALRRSSRRLWRGCFNADEVSRVVDLAKLKELKHRIVNLFLCSYDAGRNHWN